MTVSSTLDSLKANSDPYSVTASVDGGLKTTKVTGDRDTDAFTDAASENMGKMDFLTLLTTQLQYQDPLKPMDNTEFVSQLAQFSQLETMSNVGTSMEGLEKSFQDSLAVQNNSAMSVTNSSAVSLIGKEVRLRQQSFDWLGSGEAEFKVHMGERKSVNVEIFDDEGEVIQAFTVDQKDLTNAGTFKWDGKNLNGLPVDAGEYGLYIEGQEKDASLYCFVEDTVQGVRYEATGPVVKVAGKELPIGNILEVNTVVASSQNGSADLSNTQALGLVGKEIKYVDHGTSFAPKYGGEREFTIDFAGSAQASIVIRDGNGNVADKFTVSNDGSGGVKSFKVPLDDINGTGGVYSVSIENNPNAFFFKQSEISGVVPSESGMKLKVDGMVISAKDILEVNTSASSTEPGSFDLTMSQALGLVGKEVKYQDYGTSFSPEYGGERDYSVDFAGASEATIVIRDGEGNVANMFTVENDGSGRESFKIPLDDTNGTGGVYSVSIEGNPNAYFFKQSPISGVIPSGMGIKLKVDGMEISAKDILEVSA